MCLPRTQFANADQSMHSRERFGALHSEFVWRRNYMTHNCCARSQTSMWPSISTTFFKTRERRLCCRALCSSFSNTELSGTMSSELAQMTSLWNLCAAIKATLAPCSLTCSFLGVAETVRSVHDGMQHLEGVELELARGL
eukprot:6213297-Pleurochrysis_carterae.AAC.3